MSFIETVKCDHCGREAPAKEAADWIQIAAEILRDFCDWKCAADFAVTKVVVPV